VGDVGLLIGKGGRVMHTKRISVIMVLILVLAGNSFAVSHKNAGNNSRLEPASPSEVIIVPDEFVARENLETLLQKLNDPDPFIRVEAVQALGEIQRQEALLPVCSCLNDENLYVRAYDPSPYVRAMMVAALGELKDERAVEPLKKLLSDEDQSVRGMAAWALENIASSQ